MGAPGWQSVPDPTDKMMDNKGQVVVPAWALELMSDHGVPRRPSAKRGKGLQLNQTKRAQAR